MVRTRFIPVLLIRDQSLVKTIRFRKYDYIGDPCNTVRIFNELEVDEVFFLDIDASKTAENLNLKLLKDIANECFMPAGYGGGIATAENAKAIFDIGFEKISLNTAALLNENLITQVANQFGSQAVVASIDVKRTLFGKKKIYSHAQKKLMNIEPVEWAKSLESAGAGEILLTSVDQEGSWQGYDIELIKEISDAVSIPVIAHGGCGDLTHIDEVLETGNASAVAAGSYVVYQKKGHGVLINMPSMKQLEGVMNKLKAR